jgi:hypothetical protein
MSDHRVYYGPYAVCEVLLKKVEYDRPACANQSCVNHNVWLDDNYCPKCGAEVVDYKREKSKRIVDADEVQLTFEDDFCMITGSIETVRGLETKDLWVDNTSTFFGDCIDPKNWAGEIQVDLARQQLALAQFGERCDPLRESYGAENVEIRWGLLFTAD